VFASHQLGAAVAASGAGVIRDVTGSYSPAFYGAAALCAVAAALCAEAGRARLRPSYWRATSPAIPSA
jgi:cyanate permease